MHEIYLCILLGKGPRFLVGMGGGAKPLMSKTSRCLLFSNLWWENLGCLMSFHYYLCLYLSISVHPCLSLSVSVYLCISLFSLFFPVYLCFSLFIYVYLCLSLSVSAYLCLSLFIYVYLCLSLFIFVYNCRLLYFCQSLLLLYKCLLLSLSPFYII